MANTFDNDDLYSTPRDREYPSANDPEAGFYDIGAQEPVHWVDADGVPDPHEGTLSPFMYYNMPPMRQQRRHRSVMPWLIAAALVLLALPILKYVLAALAVLSFVVVVLLGLGILALFLMLVVSVFIFAHRMRTLSRRMYM